MPPSDAVGAADEFTFAKWLADTVLRWRLILKVLLLSAAAAAIAPLVFPPIFESEASFVTNTSGTSRLPAGAGSGALAGIASQFGISPGGDPSESPGFYTQLILSRELLTRVALSRYPNPRTEAPGDSASLVSILKPRGRDSAQRIETTVKRLKKSIALNFDQKTNLVSLKVTTQWPELSAAIANRAMDLVAAFNREQRVSRVRSKRLFLQSRLDSARWELRRAEDQQRMFYEQNRLWRSSPNLVFEQSRLEREVEMQLDLYRTLQTQFETARMDEFNDAALISVVDRAIPARKALWPRYGALAMTAIFIGLLLGLLVAGSAAIIDDWKERNPRAAAYLRGVRDRIRRKLRLRPVAPRERAGESIVL